MIHYAMLRGMPRVKIADVVTLPNGRCIVSWPTSTTIYDSERAARQVHLEHMGGRGEATFLVILDISPEADRGFQECYQDRCEGIGLSRAFQDWSDGGFVWEIDAPPWIPFEEREAYALGYRACAYEQYGLSWHDRDDEQPLHSEERLSEIRRQDKNWRAKGGEPRSARKVKQMDKQSIASEGGQSNG